MEEKRVNRKILYTRKVIKEAFLELLHEKPLNKITVKEICEQADVNRSTFYSHYLDCLDLLQEIEKDVANRVILKFKETFSLKSNSNLAVNGSFDMFFSMIMKNNDARFCFISNDVSGVGKQMILDYIENFYVEVWQDRGVPKESAQLFFTYICHGTIGLFKGVYSKGSTVDYEKLNQITTTIAKSSLEIMYSLCENKGD